MFPQPSCNLPQFMERRESGLGGRTCGLNDRVLSKLYHSFAYSHEKLALDHRTFVYTDYSNSAGPNQPQVGPTSGIFNLEFSPDGSLLGAACEGQNILLFDSSSRQLVASMEKAHDDCVNCIRFLDSRLFATCSDDKTVALWDARFLKRRLRTLSGHSNWVKNIEFSYRENLMVTSGFDGAICAWDINRYSDTDVSPHAKVFYTNGLMRMKLTPDGTKMVISTMNSYIMIIHELCLETMAKDLQGFKPNMYRLMQMSRKALPMAVKFTQLFHAKRNRIEFIEDFAPTNDADIIASLQIHPQGWVAASRNGSADEQSEWCCVHDIQSYPTSKDDDLTFDEMNSEGPGDRRHGNSGFARLADVLQSASTFRDPPPTLRFGAFIHQQDHERLAAEAQLPRGHGGSDGQQQQQPGAQFGSNLSNIIHIFSNFSRTTQRRRRRRRRLQRGVNPSGTSQPFDANGEPVAGPSRSAAVAAMAAAAASSSTTTTTTTTASSSSSPRMAPNQSEEYDTGNEDEDDLDVDQQNDADEDEEDNDNDDDDVHMNRLDHGFLLLSPNFTVLTVTPSVASQRQRGGDVQKPDGWPVVPEGARLHQNTRRLTHYIQESNQGRGLIKEISFSPDGRIIASPFAHGIRLLAFDGNCSDLAQCAPCSQTDAPRRLYEVCTIAKCHNATVLASAFSPHDFSLVTGCVAGKIVWHQPVL